METITYIDYLISCLEPKEYAIDIIADDDINHTLYSNKKEYQRTMFGQIQPVTISQVSCQFKKPEEEHKIVKLLQEFCEVEKVKYFKQEAWQNRIEEKE